MRVLITHTDFNDPGGVTSYFKKLRGRFKIDVIHFITGKRPGERGIWARIRRFRADLEAFALRLDNGEVDLVHLNLSLGWLAMPREALFLRHAKRRGIPIIVFFRGWVPERAAFIERRFLWLFRLMFGGADAFIVLAGAIEDTLRRWGFKQPIYREVTVIDDDELAKIDIEACMTTRAATEKWQVLFLARVLKTKGIFEAIDTAACLQNTHPNIELVIAGDGPALDEAKARVHAMHLDNVRFLGRVDGEAKHKALETAQIFFLPSYSEGFPNAMVEAMAYGLPVVIRSVGGVVDFFENGTHGYITDSYKATDFAKFIACLHDNADIYSTVAQNNVKYSRRHFAASSAVTRLETIYRRTKNKKK